MAKPVTDNVGGNEFSMSEAAGNVYGADLWKILSKQTYTRWDVSLRQFHRKILILNVKL